MGRSRVERSEEALEQVQVIRAWWIEHRPAAPDLFIDELRAAARRLGAMPRIGARYELLELREMRRMLLPRTRHHVYYVDADDSCIARIDAVWHAARNWPGGTP
ncbi:type II toxin-antitoxin system RelE/ParE family toxin [Chondromyces apiculatus]|nr:type II toxin-antitoxin system RelE/ParE family toxin [Chondromyces apiculatus]